VKHWFERVVSDGKRNDARGVAVNHSHHVGTCTVKFGVNKALKVGPFGGVRHRIAIQIVANNVLAFDHARGSVAGQQKDALLARVPHTDMTQTVHNALVIQNAVGIN
jgi:hypothetical protein